ncbi:DUF1649-domain-containing protein [Ascobolus immersus RN42]|uniref:Autophagy-related protein 101 n=1 Tax=Ascobolus immersus RN42 TaxID=1160509 RepID=A0A3N4IJ33_ASCIM|nr:DUF1649-domain-containing protein [Ascobolus immersus RN42]
MEHPQTFSLDVVAERNHVSDIVRAIISTIFFHRFFPAVRPKTRDVLDLTFPSIDDPKLDAQIDAQVSSLLEGFNNGTSKSSGRISVQFYEKRRKKSGWFLRADEQVCWEEWVLNVKLVSARTDSERRNLRTKMENQLSNAILQIITAVSHHKDHIPPITEMTSNPFPFQITVGDKVDNWGTRMGIF